MSNGGKSTRTTEELLDQLRDVGNRCADYGWYDGDGEPVTSVSLHLAAEVLNTNQLKPFIYPYYGGGIMFEWDSHLDDCIIAHSLTFLSDGDINYAYSSLPHDGPEGDVDLLNPSVEEILAQIIYP
jgi:hypothetical protein